MDDYLVFNAITPSLVAGDPLQNQLHFYTTSFINEVEIWWLFMKTFCVYYATKKQRKCPYCLYKQHSYFRM